MTFKPLQVVRTTASLRNVKGHPIAIGTRLVVINVKDGMVTARGEKRPSPDERAYRIHGPVDSFVVSKRGRPVTKKAKKVAPKPEIPPMPTDVSAATP